MTDEEIARVAHQVNKAYCAAINDVLQPEWDTAYDWMKQSALHGVAFIREHPNASVAANHENWYKEKEAQGWRYGAVKDPEAKTHPCMVDFASLPREQQVKDYLFRAVVTELLRLHHADEE